MRFGTILTLSALAVVASAQAQIMTGNGQSRVEEGTPALFGKGGICGGGNPTGTASHQNKLVDTNGFQKVVYPAKVAVALKAVKKNRLSFAKRRYERDENERDENERDENERDEHERGENERDENERGENERDEHERGENERDENERDEN